MIIREYKAQLAPDSALFLNGLKIVGKTTTLEPENLMEFYQRGFFVVESGNFLRRKDCETREIVPLDKPIDQSRLPPDMKAMLRRGNFSVSFNQMFSEVLHQCSRPEWEAKDRWLGPKLQRLLHELHRRSHAHSLEVWAGDTLAAGWIVVIAGGVPIGLTTFTRRDDKACKGAGYAGAIELHAGLRVAGFPWLDSIQPSDTSRLQGGYLANATRVNGWRDMAIERPGLAFLQQPAIFPSKEFPGQPLQRGSARQWQDIPTPRT